MVGYIYKIINKVPRPPLIKTCKNVLEDSFFSFFKNILLNFDTKNIKKYSLSNKIIPNIPPQEK